MTSVIQLEFTSFMTVLKLEIVQNKIRIVCIIYYEKKLSSDGQQFYQYQQNIIQLSP